MLSRRYINKSNFFKNRYIEGNIDYDNYLSFLEEIHDEELKSANIDRENREAEIYAFEDQQIKEARQIIARKEEEAQKELERKEKAKRQEENIKEEEKRLKSLTPEQKLHIEREKYYQREIPFIIKEYKRESRWYRKRHDRLQWFIIIGSAVVASGTSATIFINLGPLSLFLKSFSALCSLFVTIATSILGYFKYRERSNNLQKAADDIEHDYEAVKLGTHIYIGKPREEAMGIFVDRILKRIKEQKEEQQILEQPPDTKQTFPN